MCSYRAETEVVASQLRIKLNELFKVLKKYSEVHKYDEFKPKTEKELRDFRIDKKEYLNKFHVSIKTLNAEIEADYDLFARDKRENDDGLRKTKFLTIGNTAQDMTGLHRGRLAIPSAWAQSLIDQSCE